MAGAASNLLIGNQALGNALARSLGQAHVVLMRGHGSTVVAPSVRHAVLRAIYTETNASIQAAAIALGEIIYLSPEEAATEADTTVLAIERAWDFWRHEAGLFSA